jgi:hypothetical protein
MMLTTFIPVPPLFRRNPDMVGPCGDLAAPSLSERSVNLDAALQESLEATDHLETLCYG